MRRPSTMHRNTNGVVLYVLHVYDYDAGNNRIIIMMSACVMRYWCHRLAAEYAPFMSCYIEQCSLVIVNITDRRRSVIGA